MLLIHRQDKNNTGDVASNPLQYFNIKYSTLDIDNTNFNTILKSYKGNTIVIGGGGLINYNDKWNDNINYTLLYAKKNNINIYGWGLGYNKHLSDHNTHPPITFNLFTYLGLRHHMDGHNLLPCASCMNQNIQFIGYTDINPGIIEHKSNPITDICYPKINNTQPIDAIINFINQHNPIITNTYHGAYWSCLIGKSLIVYKPFSSRHYTQLGRFIDAQSPDEIPIILNNFKPQQDTLLNQARILNITMANKIKENHHA